MLLLIFVLKNTLNSHWVWALYVLLSAPLAAGERGATARRRVGAMELIGRHARSLLPHELNTLRSDASLRSDAYYFCIERLGVPRRWLELALSWHAKATRDVSFELKKENKLGISFLKKKMF